MEENVQQLLKDKNEDVVQFNFENNTSSPVAIDLFDTASLLTIPTSGTQQTTYTASNDLFPSLPPSIFALNSNNGTFIASDIASPVLRLINTTTNTTDNNFNNTIGFDSQINLNCIVTQPDGKIIVGGSFTSYKGVSANYIIRLNSDGTQDTSFDNTIGFDNLVGVIALQPDGKILVGGDFTTYKGIPANRIVRLSADGSIDATFNYGTGFDNITRSIAIQPDGKILVGGFYTTYNGSTDFDIIRLNSDGTKDLTFNNSIGFNSTARALAIQPDGKILVGGNFTTYKGVLANRIIRLNADGSKDSTFNNAIGFNTTTNVITLQPDGKILVGGLFTSYKSVTNNRIIRLNADGTKDLTFDNSIGFDANVNAITIQSDGKILVGGAFTSYKVVTAKQIIRLNSDGSKDLTFDNSNAFNGSVGTITIQPDGEILVGGAFNTYKLYTNNSIIRLNSVGNSVSLLNVDGNLGNVIYNSNNNVFYGNTGTSLYVISSDGQSVQVIILFSSIVSITYNSNNNYIYCLEGTQISVLECVTYTLVTTISLGGGTSTILSQVTPSNEIYYLDNTSLLLQKIDCNTNTLVLINLSLPNITFTNVNTLPYYNGYLYVPSNTTDKIDIVDTNTDTYFSSITINATNPFSCLFTAINPITEQLFVTDYSLTRQYAVIDLPTNTLVSVNSLGGVGGTYGVIYNPLTDSMYISGSLFSVVTFTATPFFIGGSTNYNTFVNNLNFEPIFIDEIRILTQNLTQLTNQVQFTKIDSNGNQIFFPEFPINKIDVDQNNNIAGLQLNGLVFDGRTYINQYVINPNQIVSFEIYYKQLNRFSASPTLPIFFKDKIQLKDYIKKDYNNYDVEM
jgi:uncharacterized delta-60 repeat protein